MPRPTALAPSIVLSMGLALPGVAFADGGASPAGTADPAGTVSAEMAGLEAQIDKDAQRVSTEGCAVACQALGSMRRAADRLCELDRGARCQSARGKVRDAEDRVRSSCPECAVAGGSLQPIARGEPGPPPPAPTALEPGREEVAVKGRGGCAGCAIDGERDRALGLSALILALSAALARRRGARRTRR